MLRIEPHGTNVILPAFVVGFEVFGESDFRIDDLDDSPDWLITLDHQAGGYCMTYPTVVGAVLRFADNSHHCRSDVACVTRGFQAMAEDPELAVLRTEFPALASIVCTQGDPYDAESLVRLHRFVDRYFHIPAIESGIEALVRMEHCDPLRYFADWRMLTVTLKSEADQPFGDRKRNYIDDSNIDSMRLTTDDIFSDGPLQLIRELGTHLRVGRNDHTSHDHLGVFLLWENSD